MIHTHNNMKQMYFSYNKGKQEQQWPNFPVHMERHRTYRWSLEVILVYAIPYLCLLVEFFWNIDKMF